jgi:ABC-type glycerol-3-phosphate transport system permease component
MDHLQPIMLPLIAPWLATVGILTAVEAWNEYIWPSIVMSKPDEFPCRWACCICAAPSAAARA